MPRRGRKYEVGCEQVGAQRPNVTASTSCCFGFGYSLFSHRNATHMIVPKAYLAVPNESRAADACITLSSAMAMHLWLMVARKSKHLLTSHICLHGARLSSRFNLLHYIFRARPHTCVVRPLRRIYMCWYDTSHDGCCLHGHACRAIHVMPRACIRMHTRHGRRSVHVSKALDDFNSWKAPEQLQSNYLRRRLVLRGSHAVSPDHTRRSVS